LVGRARQRQRVDAGMFAEALVFIGEQQVEVGRIDILLGVDRQTPAAVGHGIGAQKLSVAIDDGGGDFSRVRQRQRAEGNNPGGEAGGEAKNDQAERCEDMNRSPCLSRHSGMARRTRPGISRFSGAQLRTKVRCFASPRNDRGYAMSYITGVGLTSYGKHEGLTSLDLMSKAAELAIADAGLKRAEIDGILCGYSTVSPHIMLATVFAEHFGIRPSYAHAVQVGGATGLAMTMLAHHLVEAG